MGISAIHLQAFILSRAFRFGMPSAGGLHTGRLANVAAANLPRPHISLSISRAELQCFRPTGLFAHHWSR